MSWATGKRDVENRGVEGLRFVFTDTLIEDADLYRFLIEGAANILGRELAWRVPSAEDFPQTYLPVVAGARPEINPAWLAFLTALRERCALYLPELAWIADGRTPWQVFRDEKLIGNTRADPCSKILKRELGLRWLVDNCDPAETTLLFGIHWEEQERLEGLAWDNRLKAKVLRGVRPRYRALGWSRVEAPMCDKPWVAAQSLRDAVTAEGMALPRLYTLGFAHNNCGGFCIKAGEGHFKNLLERLPGVFAAHEAEEAAFNAERPGRARKTVLAPREPKPGGGERRVPITLEEFRLKIERGGQVNLFDTGGCGCFLDDAA
jgi:hypothetical protein